ncbi:MAG: CAP domain-containing protein [Chthoniobacterales bacterium]
MNRLGLALLLSLLLHPPAFGDNLHGKTAGGAVIRELNLARQNPELYASFLEQMRGRFHGHLFFKPGGGMRRTSEGLGAVDEAIRFLRHVRPIEPLTLSAGLSMAAAEHVTDQASGAFGHAGSDQSGPGERIGRHGIWSGRWGEDISYGYRTARNIVIVLIVDDGRLERGHRKIIFDPAFHCAGAAVGPHARYRAVCSIDFAGGYVEKAACSNPLLAGN